MKISIIVPCFNEEEVLELFYIEIKNILESMSDYEYEIIFVDDGSTDDTLNKIKKLALQDKNVSFLSFSRNFGKEAAIYAGFCNVQGNLVCVMDADLQDPPTLIPEMIKIILEKKYDSVATRRISRNGEPIIRSWFAKKFYQIINTISDADIVDGARDFRLMKREMVDSIVAMGEYNRFSKGIFGWIGFRTYWMAYENIERVAGNTKWNFWKLFKYAVDGIINFSHVPLSFASWGGVCMTFLSFVFMFFIIFRKIIWGDPVAGWASIICIIVFIGGIQLLCLGIIGQYIAKMYMETKNRPHYIIAETNRKDVRKIR